MNDPVLETLKACLGKSILNAHYHNTVSIGDIYRVVLTLNDGSRLEIGWGPCVGNPNHMLAVKFVPTPYSPE